MLKNLSSKKIFFYISLLILFIYGLVLVALRLNHLADILFKLETLKTYYLIIYLILAAISYYLDSSLRKEPGFLSLFFLPAISFLYLFISMSVGGAEPAKIVVMSLVMCLLVIASYFIYVKLMPKVLTIKHLYGISLFLYTVIHLTVVLLISNLFLI